MGLTPVHILLLFLFAQPFLGFTRDDTLDLIKHLFLRGFVLSMLLYTLYSISMTTARLSLPAIGLEKELLIYIFGITLSCLVALVEGIAVVSRTITSVATVPLLIVTMYIICYWFDTREKIIKAARYFLLSVASVCIIGLAEFALLTVMGEHPDGRLHSVFVDPNIFARYVLFGIFFIISLLYFRGDRIYSKTTLYGFLGLYLINLLLSLSRSGYLTLIAGCILFSFYLGNRKIRLSVIVGAILVGVLIFAYLFAQRDFSSGTVVEPSNINRVILITGGLDMIRTHWLMGIGYTNFANFFETYYLGNTLSLSAEAYKYAGYATEIHNWVIEAWAEQGIIGLAIFLLLMRKLFQVLRHARARENDPTMKALLIGFSLMGFTFLFHGFFYHTFISQFFFWTVTAFGIAAANVSTKSVQ
jgi:O-antigen ligase